MSFSLDPRRQPQITTTTRQHVAGKDRLCLCQGRLIQATRGFFCKPVQISN